MTTRHLLAALLALPTLASAQPGLTIYNGDFAVVRDTIDLDLDQGTHQVVYEDATLSLEPDSVILLDPAGSPLRVVEQSYRNDALTEPYLLSLHEGQTLDFLVEQPEKPDRIVSARIIRSGYPPQGAASTPVLEIDGKIRFGLPGQPLFPSLGDDTVLKPRLVWTIDTPQPVKTSARVAYITGGLDWQASYNLVSPEQGDTIDLVGWITMENNSGRDFQNASVKLMAGDVNKIAPPTRMREMLAMPMADAAPAVTEKAFDEFHLYSIARPTTLRDRETKQVEFLRASNVASKTLYIYDPTAPSLYRWLSAAPDTRRTNRQLGSESSPKVAVFREFDNTADNNLGLPLPAGRVRFYRDNDGQLEFTGENTIDHTPRNETLTIATGDAFDIVGERKRTNLKIDSANNRASESFEITIRNRKTTPVTVTILEHPLRSATWRIDQSSIPFTKNSSTGIEFQLPVPADSPATLTYSIDYTW
jgi:hypothetical protein